MERLLAMDLGSLLGKTISIRLTEDGAFICTVRYGRLYRRSEVCPMELPDAAHQKSAVDDSSSSSAEY